MAEVKIMIVEDENILMIGYKKMLKKHGYNVVATASTGEEAAMKAKEKHPDLILMDIKLKGDMDGIDTAHQIHDSHFIPVVFITAFPDDITMKRASKTMPFGYLIKPVRERELNGAIEIALYKHKMADRERRSREIQESLNSILKVSLATISFKDQLHEILDHCFHSLAGISEKSVWLT